MKINISKALDARKLIHRLWILLWVVLLVCLVIKLLFNKWYPIISDSETFNNIANYIDNHDWIRYTFLYTIYILSTNIIILTSTANTHYKKAWHAILINLIYTMSFILKAIFGAIIGYLEMVYTIGICAFINYKSNRYKNLLMCILLPIIVCIIVYLWQLNILFVRGIQEVLSDAPSVIVIIMQIDYYIFLILTYLEVNYMGLASLFWLFSEAELEALREKELKKANPDEKLLKQIDARLAQLKK